MNEILDLYAILLQPPRVEWVDGFDGTDAVIRYLKEHPDAERSYCVTDIGNHIRAVAFFRRGQPAAPDLQREGGA